MCGVCVCVCSYAQYEFPISDSHSISRECTAHPIRGTRTRKFWANQISIIIVCECVCVCVRCGRDATRSAEHFAGRSTTNHSQPMLLKLFIQVQTTRIILHVYTLDCIISYDSAGCAYVCEPPRQLSAMLAHIRTTTTTHTYGYIWMEFLC